MKKCLIIFIGLAVIGKPSDRFVLSDSPNDRMTKPKWNSTRVGTNSSRKPDSRIEANRASNLLLSSKSILCAVTCSPNPTRLSSYCQCNCEWPIHLSYLPARSPRNRGLVSWNCVLQVWFRGSRIAGLLLGRSRWASLVSQLPQS